MRNPHGFFYAYFCDMRGYFKLLIFILGCISIGFGQQGRGIPFIKNYLSNQYDASPENWAIAQDRFGIMYFGNNRGVLQFDGVRWRLIPVSNNSVARSIAIDSSGTIYIGAVGEFGFLEPEANGFMVYHSLLNKLPAEEREFADVWKTYATPEGIYFQAFSKIIRFSNGTIKIWKPETSFHLSYYVNGHYYVNEREKGLKEVKNDQLTAVRQGEIFSSQRIYSMLPYGNGKALLASREKGLFIMNTESKDSVFTFLPSALTEDLADQQVYAGARLGENSFAYATLKKGIFIIDRNGAVVATLNKSSGLADDIIKNVAVDDAGDLWAALGNGISHIEFSSPLTTVNEEQGLKGFVQDIMLHKNSLYVATSLGVYRKENNEFLPVADITTQTRSLKEINTLSDTILLAASEAGIFKIEKDKAVLLQEGFGNFIFQSVKNPEHVYVGMNDGLLSLRYENKKWVSEDYFAGIEEEIRSVAEDKEGNLWLGTPFNGLLRIKFNGKNDTLFSKWKTSYSIKRLDTANGLPSPKYNIPYNFKGKMLFATIKGIYEFDNIKERFFISSFLQKELKDHQVFRMAFTDSSVWLVTVDPAGKKETGIAILKKGETYSWYTQPFQKIFEREIHAVFPSRDITWLGGPEGLLNYDASVKKDFFKPFHTLIRTVSNAHDSIFGGSVDSRHPLQKPEIKYQNNSLQFEYAAASFGDEKNNLFSIYLEGYDKEWSDWSRKTEKEYTNLKEGSYTFHVKAKNIYGTEGLETTYSFTILPPWYRTVWAYIVYVILFVGLVYLIIRLSIRRLVRAKNRLEAVVKERTAEVVSQKHLVEEKQKEIIDSINYAQRIQRALLAGEKLLNENLPNHFVFFQPKDIVSGDFYWGALLPDNRFALVTADSTGHGVPGAIMSMLNISCLNEAVSGQHLTEPDEILNYARKRVINHLANDGSAEGGKDGMDCTLLCIDLPHKTLTYAAANNPLWIVREQQIIEYDPDKMPVGKHDRDNIPFKKHGIDLLPGDMIYTSTDGMPDQFGGPKGKKFMYKQLKELFIGISVLPLPEQKEKLSAALNNWKGEQEQVDDVCIIGIRINI